MRLPGDVRFGALAALSFVLLTGCGAGGSSGYPKPAGIAPVGQGSVAKRGPAADYPMVLGDPFTIDGETYTPSDTLNYDRVGYAALDQGDGVTAASKTLPLPSYVEITSLETGKTILVRVERRGPMTNARLVALSPDAASQLAASDGTPVRVRRVNPPEVERAELRSGRPAGERLETPKSLVEVLKRKLPPNGEASLQSRAAAPADPTPASAKAPGVINTAKKPPIAGTASPEGYALKPLAKTAVAPPVASASSAKPKPTTVEKSKSDASGGFLIQAGAFSIKSNADRAARSVGGFVTRSGNLYMVRSGPYRTRGQAEAALVKVRAAGYSDARVISTS